MNDTRSQGRLDMRKSRTFQQEGGGKRSRSDGGNSIGVEKKSALQVFDGLEAASLKPSLVFMTVHPSVFCPISLIILLVPVVSIDIHIYQLLSFP